MGDKGFWNSVPNAPLYHYDPSTKDDSNHHMASVGRTVDYLADASQQPAD